MHRALIKIFVVLALALGLTYTTATGSTAAPVAEGVAARAADCSSQQAALAKARDTYGRRVSVAKRVRNALEKAERSERRAQTRKAEKAAHAKVVKARKRLRVERTKVSRAKAHVVSGKRKLKACQDSDTPPSPASSPIQVLCTAGLPQELCDQLAALIPGGSTASPLSLLCAQAPQAQPLCDLISTGTAPDPTELLDVIDQILGDLGLLDLLGTLLGGLGLGDVLDDLGLDSLLDLLGLGDLLP